MPEGAFCFARLWWAAGVEAAPRSFFSVRRSHAVRCSSIRRLKWPDFEMFVRLSPTRWPVIGDLRVDNRTDEGCCGDSFWCGSAAGGNGVAGPGGGIADACKQAGFSSASRLVWGTYGMPGGMPGGEFTSGKQVRIDFGSAQTDTRHERISLSRVWLFYSLRIVISHDCHVF
jgi:hypothetical protein